MTGKERLSITLFYSRLKKTGFEVAFVAKIGLRRNGVMVIEGRMPGQLLSTETSGKSDWLQLGRSLCDGVVKQGRR